LKGTTKLFKCVISQWHFDTAVLLKGGNILTSFW